MQTLPVADLARDALPDVTADDSRQPFAEPLAGASA
jgi:hypothetical protein